MGALFISLSDPMIFRGPTHSARSGKLNQRSDFITLLGDRAYFIAPLIYSNKRRLPGAPTLKYNPPSCSLPWVHTTNRKRKEKKNGGGWINLNRWN